MSYCPSVIFSIAYNTDSSWFCCYLMSSLPGKMLTMRLFVQHIDNYGKLHAVLAIEALLLHKQCIKRREWWKQRCLQRRKQPTYCKKLTEFPQNRLHLYIQLSWALFSPGLYECHKERGMGQTPTGLKLKNNGEEDDGGPALLHWTNPAGKLKVKTTGFSITLLFKFYMTYR